jgi:hypothetical protein
MLQRAALAGSDCANRQVEVLRLAAPTMTLQRRQAAWQLPAPVISLGAHTRKCVLQQARWPAMDATGACGLQLVIAMESLAATRLMI